ncbi:LysR family transcriptional regulator [Caballeronia temeraria]|uniref:LysR family transcriptional regulator n=1 Tax=Caballeronia temeraria TaxID=1777137 RepID=A0A158DW13_9BURK|nr:LysR substrate-binding domain-containing protein [Caballeronia temeraria]SAK98811.1 LysR family transcriptional regulator [Caballeronia temeraria]
MNRHVDLNDLRVFHVVAQKASFAAAADFLVVSPAYVSKRIQLLESALDAPLLFRSTRRVAMTEAGERLFRRAQQLLDEADRLIDDVCGVRHAPRGMLRISSSFGFGRRVVAPVLARFIETHSQLNVRLDLFDRIVDVAAEGYDLDIRVGNEIAPHLIARRLATNHRILCASPDYLRARSTPGSIADLQTHECLCIKERDHPFGVWRFVVDGEDVRAKVSGALASNDGEAAVQWALAGRGIMLRSIWNVRSYLDDGSLIQVLPHVTQPADVFAVYPLRLATSARVKACVEFLESEFSSGAWSQHR